MVREMQKEIFRESIEKKENWAAKFDPFARKKKLEDELKTNEIGEMENL